MLASLASCVAFYARRYLRRHHLDATGLTVTARHRMATHPNRVGDVDLLIHLPTELTPSRRAGLLAQAGHCTVHNTLVESPTIAISLGGAASEPA
ncbi:MAG: OsmC family protein [Actinomycetota bacterium]|nr:OsmC family protein [Actinomycetota bacterium]